MRSTFAGLNTMVRGLETHQLALSTVGQNLSNDATPGYSREEVNMVPTAGDEIYGLYGREYVGSGVDAASISRIRDIFLDKHYWNNNSQKEYYNQRQQNYNFLENIFNDSQVNSTDVGLKSSINSFWKAWQTLSTNADATDNRINVRNTAQTMCDKIHDMAQKVQGQINTNYQQLQADITTINQITGQILDLNKNIVMREATGGKANALRDQRDALVDKLSKYLNINVVEQSNGAYAVSSNGSVLVDGRSNLQLGVQEQNNKDYGITDYNIIFKETGTIFSPTGGQVKAIQDSVAEDKTYIDKLANFSAFFLTTFNAQHQEGYGIDGANNGEGTTDTNFFGDNTVQYSWQYKQLDKDFETSYVEVMPGKNATNKEKVQLRGINIINALNVSEKIMGPDGINYIAAKGANIFTGTQNFTDKNGNPVSPDGYTDHNGHQVVPGDCVDADGNYVDYEHRIPANNGTAGPANGDNAVTLSNLFNTSLSKAVINSEVRKVSGMAVAADGTMTSFSPTQNDSLDSFYNNSMVTLGTNANVTDQNVTKMQAVVTQLENMRQSVSGVNWNDELTNMIKFQQGYSACSRVLTTMDQMLDKLINGTGMVGRG